MAKKTNTWFVASMILIGILVLGLFTGFIVLGGGMGFDEQGIAKEFCNQRGYDDFQVFSGKKSEMGSDVINGLSIRCQNANGGIADFHFDWRR